MEYGEITMDLVNAIVNYGIYLGVACAALAVIREWWCK